MGQLRSITSVFAATIRNAALLRLEPTALILSTASARLIRRRGEDREHIERDIEDAPRGLELRVGHLERFNPALIAVRDRILRPRFMECHRLAPFKPRSTDVDVVLDLMIHDIDIILSLVPAEVVEVRASGVPVLTDSVDIANARIEFADGCVANVTASRVSAKSMRKLRVFQPDTYVSIDFESRECAVARKLPGEGRDGMPKIDHELRRFAQGDSLEAELRAFVDAVRGRARPGATGREGRRALDLALAVSHRIRAGLK